MAAPKTIVYTDLETRRILGFSPEGIAPIFPSGTRYVEHIPFDTLELEKWFARYRAQQQQDAQERAYRRVNREKPFRDAIRSAIMRRNLSVNAINRDYNNTLVKFMDARYDAMIAQQAKPEVFGVAEAYEESFSGEDLAMARGNIQLAKSN